MITNLLPLQSRGPLSPLSAGGIWKRLISKFSKMLLPVHDNRFYLAHAEIVALLFNTNTGEERPLVHFSTVHQQPITTLLVAAFPVGRFEPGHRLSVLYDVRIPAQAVWAGRSWRNEPAQALSAARTRHRRLLSLFT